MCPKWAIKNHPSYFHWNFISSPYLIEPIEHTKKKKNKTKNKFGLKYDSEVESGGKGCKVVSQFNFKCQRGSFRFIGTHFDRNQNIIKIFIFGLSHRSLSGYVQISDPLYRGVAVTRYIFFFDIHVLTQS